MLPSGYSKLVFECKTGQINFAKIKMLPSGGVKLAFTTKTGQINFAKIKMLPSGFEPESSAVFALDVLSLERPK